MKLLVFFTAQETATSDPVRLTCTINVKRPDEVDSKVKAAYAVELQRPEFAGYHSLVVDQVWIPGERIL